MEKIKIALLGAGNIGRVHLNSCKDASNIAFAGVYDIVTERAQEVAQTFGIKAYTTLDEIWADETVRGVLVAVPNDRHDLLTIQAAEHGKHVLCEKPMTLTSKQAQHMANCCKEHGVELLMGFCNRFLPETDALMRYIRAGEMGELYFAKTDTLRRRGMPEGWFGNRDKSGGGPLIDIGVHVIDVAWYMMGRPRPMLAKALQYVNKITNPLPDDVVRYSAYEKDAVMNVEDSSHGLITFENGAGLMYQAAWAINDDSREDVFLYGTKAGASLWPAKLTRDELGVMTTVTPCYQPGDCYQRQLEHFARVITHEELPRSPAQDGIIVQKMLEALYCSAQSGHEVVIDN